MTDPETPSDARTAPLERFSGHRSVVDQLVIEGLARAIRERRISKDFGELLIRAYLNGRNEKTPE